MKDQLQHFNQIIQIVITLGSMATAIIIAVSKILQSKKIELLKDEQIKLSVSFRTEMESLKDERIKFLEFIGSKETNEQLINKLDEKNNACINKQEKIKKLEEDLKATREAYYFLLVHGKIYSTNEINIIAPMKLLSIINKSFKYLKDFGLTKVNAYESENDKETGVKKQEWEILCDMEIFSRTQNDEIELTSEGKIIYEHYKLCHDVII